MILVDVNILVYAFREDSPSHPDYKAWLDDVVGRDASFGISDLVLSGFLRVVTHPRVFKTPSSMTRGVEFVEAVRSQPNSVVISPGPRHWEIFLKLCSTSGVKGNLVPDSFLAALAIESGSEWITADRDYARFPGLRWRHPLD